MATLEIRALRKRFGSLEILKGIDISLEQGGFLVLVGPSGCGKSTLLNTIAGLESISSGEILIGGQVVNDLHPSKRDIAMVFQSYSLYPRMSVEMNLSFGLRIAKVPKDEIAKRVAKASKLLQLDPLLQRKPVELSGGQRQRVAIGRALVRNVDVFLFDEPLSNLDAKLRNELRVEIKKLHQEIGNTMIYVTHDQVEALTLADRIAVMKGGVIQQFDSPHEIYHHPANLFVAGFIGSPAMNTIEGSIVQRDGVWRFEALGISVDVTRYPFANGPKAGSATLGVRPEHIGVGDAPRERHAAMGKVTIVEPMGGEAVLWTSLAGKPATIKVAGDSDVKVGDDLRFHFDMARASLFEGQTGQRL